jgi:hypothetical protein
VLVLLSYCVFTILFLHRHSPHTHRHIIRSHATVVEPHTNLYEHESPHAIGAQGAGCTVTLNNTSAHQLLRPRESTRDLRAGRLSFALECVHGRCERRALQIPQRSRHLSPPISPVAPFGAPMMMFMLSRDRPSCTGAPARRQFPRPVC